MDGRLVLCCDSGGIVFFTLKFSFYLKEKFSSRTFWWHILLINVPKSLSSATKAILYIDSGDNINPNLTLNNYVSKISEKFNCITATLGQNPNMPIKFFV